VSHGLVNTTDATRGQNPRARVEARQHELEASVAKLPESDASQHLVEYHALDAAPDAAPRTGFVEDIERRALANQELRQVLYTAEHCQLGPAPLKLYTLYAPPNHRDGVVHHTRADADTDDEGFDGKITEPFAPNGSAP
jgi:hypothetical protein